MCAARLSAACTQGPGGGGIGLASGQDPDPATVDFPIFYIRHQVPEDQDDVTRVRPFVEDDDYSATLWKRDRASPGAPETEITARLRTAAAGASRRPLRHQGSRRRARRPARGLRDARPARRRRRRRRTPDLEHLGIQHRDRHAAPRDQLGHHRGRRPGRRARLSTRRPHRCSRRRASGRPRPSCSTRARRSSKPRPRRATSPRSCCTS